MDSKPPGWNDPPTIPYEKGCEISASVIKRTSLTKRVPIPLDRPYKTGEGIDPTIPPSPMDLSKIGTPPKVISPLLSNQSAGLEKRTSLADENIKDCLKEVLHSLRTANGQGKMDEEIAKRIDVMEKMWLDEKLDFAVMKKVCDLAKALSLKDLETADRIQKALMVDHISQCSSWMGGIRHLINKMREDAKVGEDNK